MHKQIFRGVFPLLSCLLTIYGVAHAQAPSVTPAGGSPLAKTEKASEMLAHARQIYSEEGARPALSELEKALALFRKEDDRKGEAITTGLIGNCYKKLGEHQKALDYLQRALAMKRELGDRIEEGKTLSHLGLLYWEMSQYPLAIEHFDKAIAIGHGLGDRILEASARNNLGLVYDELGEYAEALGYYQQSLAIDERLKLKPSICLDLENIGLCYVGVGRAGDAIQTLDRALLIAREDGLKKEEADCQKAKGSALMQLGRYTEALDWYRQARQAYEQVGLNAEPEFKQQLIEALSDLGNIEVRLGDVASAEKDFRRAIEISEAIKHPRGITINLIALGDLEWRRKRLPEAAALYRQALARANEANDRASTASARIQLALTYRDLKRLDEAANEAQQAREIARATQARPLEVG